MEKLIHESAIEIVTKEVSKTKFIPQQNATGVTFFEGKQRLVKIVNTKRNLKLEINLQLSDSMIKKLEGGNGILKHITKEEAHKKKLGTMKFLYTDNSDKMVSAIIKDLLKGYLPKVTESQKVTNTQKEA